MPSPIRVITIRPILNGYLATVGCQDIAFTSADALLRDLASYLQDPVAVEAYYLSNAINSPKSPLCPPPTGTGDGGPDTDHRPSNPLQVTPATGTPRS